MKRIGVCLFCIVILAMTGCIRGSHQSGLGITDADIFEDASFFDNTDLISTRLANGLTVLIKPDRRFPVVSTRLYVRAGSAIEPSEKAGISHLLEHMVFKGTERRPKGAIAAEIEAVGGYLNAATSFDYTVYLNDLPAKEWKLGIESVADMAFNAVLDERELRSEKDVVIAELKRGKDNPHSVLFQLIQKYALAETSYARPIIGFENTVRSVSSADMRAYIREYYQPGNMLLCVVGDVDSDTVLREAERIFSVYENRGFRDNSKAFSPASLLPSGATVNVERGPWNKAYFSLAIPVPGVRNVQSATLDMLASLLGGGETSFFVKKYKYDQKLVDSVTVNNMSFDRVGLFTVTAELDAAKVSAFWEQLISDLSVLTADIFTQSEMDRICLNTEEGVARSRETVSGLASHLGYLHFIVGGDQSELNYIRTMRAVDRHMLDAVIRSYIAPRRFSASLIVPQTVSEEISSEALKRTLDRLWPRPDYIKKPQPLIENQTEIIELGNGRTVILIPDRHMRHISLTMAFFGGMALTLPNEQGLADLAARCVTAGTRTMPRKEFDAAVEDCAASIGAQAGRLRFSVSLEAPSRFADKVFGIFSETINAPAFDPIDVEYEKEMQIAAIAKSEDTPLGLLFRNLPPFLFGENNVFGYVSRGRAEMISEYTSGQIYAFWERQKRSPWVLAVSGSFDRESVLAFARTLPEPLSDVQPGNKTGKKERLNIVDAPDWGKEYDLELPFSGRKQAHLLLVYPTVPNTDADTPALNVLENAVGGMSGRLFASLRDEKGLGYTVSAFNVQNSTVGYMAFYIGTDPLHLNEAEKAFIEIISDLGKNDLDEAEIKRGFRHWEGEYYRSLQGLSSRSEEAVGLLLDGRPLDENRKMLERASLLTPADIRHTAAKYLKGRPYRIIVCP